MSIVKTYEQLRRVKHLKQLKTYEQHGQDLQSDVQYFRDKFQREIRRRLGVRTIGVFTSMEQWTGGRIY